MRSIDRLLRDLVAQLFGAPAEKPAKPARSKAAEKRPAETCIATAEVAADQREVMRQALVASPLTPAVRETARVAPIQSMEPTFNVVAWSVPKPGNRPDQNQDAHASLEKDGGLRLCMSDGVTEASFDSRSWAAALCQSFLERPKGAVRTTWLDQRLQSVAGTFAAKVEARVANVDTTKAYSWLAKPRAEQGSKATLLSVELGPMSNATLRWKAFAVGDTNLFVVRDGKLLQAWPLQSSRDFGMTADVASTKAASDTAWRIGGAGSVRGGDQLYLMTDALAQYVLRRDEANDPVWRSLSALDGEEAFAAFVERARADGMTLDDTTLQRIVVGKPTSGRE